MIYPTKYDFLRLKFMLVKIAKAFKKFKILCKRMTYAKVAVKLNH